MHPPDSRLAPLPGAETWFRIFVPKTRFCPYRPQGTKADGIPTILGEGEHLRKWEMAVYTE